MELDRQQLKDNPRTQFFALELDRLDERRRETEELAATEPSMAELAASEIANIDQQIQAIESQITEILEKEAQEDQESPKTIILELRAGAGGERGFSLCPRVG